MNDTPDGPGELAADTVPPTQFIEFGGLQIAFDSRVLRPRTWTEHQSRWAAELLPDLPPGTVLELCSGAGQIGLLAIAGSTRRLVCADVNPVAAQYAASNAITAGMRSRVEIRLGRIGDVLAPKEQFPLIIADPPWVRRSETERFPEDPLVAIDGGVDGLGVVRQCLTAIAEHLADDGVALLQLGPGDQVGAAAELLAGTGLATGEVRGFEERGVLVRIEREG